MRSTFKASCTKEKRQSHVLGRPYDDETQKFSPIPSPAERLWEREWCEGRPGEIVRSTICKDTVTKPTKLVFAHAPSDDMVTSVGSALAASSKASYAVPSISRHEN